MQTMTLGYFAPDDSSESHRCRERFRERSEQAGLPVRFEHRGHVVAGTPMSAPHTIDDREWRVLHFEGCLHQRATLAVHGVPAYGISDREAVERLLCSYGPAALAWLLGDWAIVAASQSSLLMATDYFGNRPLYYHMDRDDALWWSNCDWMLAECCGKGDTLDRIYIAGLLFFLPPPDRTAFGGVYAVPAGHARLQTRTGCDLYPYWTPRQRMLVLADPREYALAFYEQLSAGVRDRLAVPGRTWIEISGGVDSALVAATAAASIESSPELGPVTGVHYTTERPEGNGDRTRAHDVARMHGLPLRTFSLESLLDISTRTSLFENPREPFGAFREAPRIAEREGARVFMSGRLGDLVTGNREPEPGLLPTLAKDQGIGHALQALYDWAVAAETPVWHLLARMVRDRMLDTPERKLLAKLFSNFSQAGPRVDTLAGPLLPSLHDAVDEWRPFQTWPERASLDYAHEWWWFAVNTMRLSGTYAASWCNSTCHRTYPFADRRLIEFVISSPWTAFLEPARPRHLIHEQLADLLPSTMAGRTFKSDTASWRLRPLKVCWSAMRESHRPLQIVEQGLVNDDTLDRVEAAFAVDPGLLPAAGGRLMQIEWWLRHRPRRWMATHPNTEGGECHALREA